MKMIQICAMMLIVIFSLTPLYAETNPQLFQKAMKFAKDGEMDLAFMNYHSILSDPLSSRYADEALFACAEYQYLVRNFFEANVLFRKYVDTAQSKQGKLFALVYLMRIAQEKKDLDAVAEIRKQVISFKRHSFIFKDFREYNFLSPLRRAHKATYNINKIEFFIEGEFFAKISY